MKGWKKRTFAVQETILKQVFYFDPKVFLTQARVLFMSSLKRFNSSGARFGGLGFSAGVA